MSSESPIDKQTIINNITSFCSNDAAAGQELFEIIQKSIAESFNLLNTYFKENSADNFRKTAHKLRFSLSIIKVEATHQQAIYIDDCINEMNFNNVTQQEIMIQFINKIEVLNKELNK